MSKVNKDLINKLLNSQLLEIESAIYKRTVPFNAATMVITVALQGINTALFIEAGEINVSRHGPKIFRSKE